MERPEGPKSNRRELLSGLAALAVGGYIGLHADKRKGARIALETLFGKRVFPAELLGRKISVQSNGSEQYLLFLNIEGKTAYYEVHKEIFHSFRDQEISNVEFTINEDRTLNVKRKGN